MWFHEIFVQIFQTLPKVWSTLTVFEPFWLLRLTSFWKRWPFWNFSGQFRFTGNIINGSRLLCGCQTCLLLFWWRISYSVTNSIDTYSKPNLKVLSKFAIFGQTSILMNFTLQNCSHSNFPSIWRSKIKVFYTFKSSKMHFVHIWRSWIWILLDFSKLLQDWIF